jgi:hypothetical protein
MVYFEFRIYSISRADSLLQLKNVKFLNTFLTQMTYIICKLEKTTYNYKTCKRLPGFFKFLSYELLKAYFQTSTQEFCEILAYCIFHIWSGNNSKTAWKSQLTIQMSCMLFFLLAFYWCKSFVLEMYQKFHIS